MNISNPSTRYYDYLRAAGILAVLLIHINTPVLNMNFGKNMEYWWFGLIVNNLGRYAIPIFLVLSGATLLHKQEPISVFYKKRFSRVLFPFLFWLPAYAVFRWFMLQSWQRPFSIESIWDWFTNLFIREGISVHLWYVYMILFLYLLTPFIARIVQRISINSIVVLLVCWLLFNNLQYLGLFSVPHFSVLGKKLDVYLLYSGYMILGYALTKVSDNFIIAQKWWWLLYGFTVIAGSGVTWYVSYQLGKQSLVWMNSFGIFAFLQTIAVFFIAKNIRLTSAWLDKCLGVVSEYSFGLYFVHIMVISLFFRVGIFWTMAHPVFSVPMVLVLTFFTSLFVIYVLRKMPLNVFK